MFSQNSSSVAYILNFMRPSWRTFMGVMTLSCKIGSNQLKTSHTCLAKSCYSKRNKEVIFNGVFSVEKLSAIAEIWTCDLPTQLFFVPVPPYSFLPPPDLLLTLSSGLYPGGPLNGSCWQAFYCVCEKRCNNIL